ncbi:MAG: acyl-CoA dehydrogenase family protein [Hyphomicrobiaceae bacterium]
MWDSFDPSWRLLRQSVQSWLESAHPRTSARTYEASGHYGPAFVQSMIASGWLGLGIAEEHGGANSPLADRLIVERELARALCGPLFASQCIAADVVAEFGTATQQAALLPAMARGEELVAVAWSGERGDWRNPADGASLSPSSRLTARRPFVRDIPNCTSILCFAEKGGLTVAALIPLANPGIKLTAIQALDGPAHSVVMEATVPAERVLAAGDRTALERVIASARLTAAAELLGYCDLMCELTWRYVQQRQQFGRPIASFQMIQERCADMADCLAEAEAAIWMAASVHEPTTDLALTTKAIVSSLANRVMMNGMESHGGMSSMSEYDANIPFRRGKAAELSWGSAADLTEQLAARADPTALDVPWVRELFVLA